MMMMMKKIGWNKFRQLVPLLTNRDISLIRRGRLYSSCVQSSISQDGCKLVTRVALCCHSNATRAPIANPPNSAQLGGSLYHAPKLHPGPCSSVGIRPRTDRHTDTQTHRQTDTQTCVTTIHFASSMTHAKCKNSLS